MPCVVPGVTTFTSLDACPCGFWACIVIHRFESAAPSLAPPGACLLRANTVSQANVLKVFSGRCARIFGLGATWSGLHGCCAEYCSLCVAPRLPAAPTARFDYGVCWASTLTAATIQAVLLHRSLAKPGAGVMAALEQDRDGSTGQPVRVMGCAVRIPSTATQTAVSAGQEPSCPRIGSGSGCRIESRERRAESSCQQQRGRQRARLDDLRSRAGVRGRQTGEGSRSACSADDSGTGCIPGCYFKQVLLKSTIHAGWSVAVTAGASTDALTLPEID
jgi:hypothetical protein